MRQSLDNCFRSRVSGGVDDAAYAEILTQVEGACEALRQRHRAGELPLFDMATRADDIPAMNRVAQWLGKAKHVVFLGTGGSSLGGQALAQVSGWGVPGAHGCDVNIHFLDNLDAAGLEHFLDSIPLEETRFLAVSKSGRTGETLIQTIAVLQALVSKELGVSEHVYGLTEPGDNKLRRLLEPYGVSFAQHETAIGGRFSALTNVGLIPAALCGMDVGAVRAGAQDALEAFMDSRIPHCDAAKSAALSVAAALQGTSISVLWAYADRLKRFASWYVQLWSESLGKDGKGTTPLAAAGPVDQHSQLQLFLDGPADKLITVILIDTRGLGAALSNSLAEDAGEPDFGGRHVGDFVWAQANATVDTLARNGRPVRTLLLKTLDARAIGRLMMHFMLETIIAAELFGVNAFDQPAVEEGKILAKQYLARG